MRSPPRISIGMPTMRFDALDGFTSQPIMQFKELEPDRARLNEYLLWLAWQRAKPVAAELRRIDTSRSAAMKYS